MANYFDLNDFKKKRNSLENDNGIKKKEVDVDELISTKNDNMKSHELTKQDMAKLIAKNIANIDDEPSYTNLNRVQKSATKSPEANNRTIRENPAANSNIRTQNIPKTRNNVATEERTATASSKNEFVKPDDNSEEDSLNYTLPLRNNVKAGEETMNRKPVNSGNHKRVASTKSKRNKRKSSKSIKPGVMGTFIAGFVIIACIAFYVGGRVLVSDKFLPNTKINGEKVGMMTVSQAISTLQNAGVSDYLTLIKNDGTEEKIKFNDFDYIFKFDDKVKALYNKQSKGLWFKSLFSHNLLKIDTSTVEYNEDKLDRAISDISWGETKPTDAYISTSDNGFAIVPEKVGDKLDVEKLCKYVKEKLDKGETEINITSSGAYLLPTITSADLEGQLDNIKAVGDIEITFDFDYTTEVLKGQDFIGWLKFNEDGSYTVDKEKAKTYVEQLGDKYDTYARSRKFHATLQGDITVPHSRDAIYGWWIHTAETTDLLVSLLEDGKSVTTDPIYYYKVNADGTKGYTFVGNEATRTADDDIGKTYVEIDLTAQTLWYYKDGKKLYECPIVSGKLTDARKTQPGAYKLWYKATNYTMNGSNSDGEKWTAKCSYWNRVALVGVGLHDSSRASFGGTVYKEYGSHGCINMRYNDVKYIYENVELGTPVMMYY